MLQRPKSKVVNVHLGCLNIKHGYERHTHCDGYMVYCAASFTLASARNYVALTSCAATHSETLVLLLPWPNSCAMKLSQSHQEGLKLGMCEAARVWYW